MIYVSHRLPVNEPGSPRLTRSDVWDGLVLKANNALPFVPAMTYCEVVTRHSDTVFDRDIDFRGQRFTERITLEAPHRVVFTRIAGPVLGTITNEIEGGDDEFGLRFSFALAVAGVPGGSEQEAAYAAGMTGDYLKAVAATLGAARRRRRVGGGPVSGRLDGRVAVVTGAANGIGRVYAQRLAAEGAAVAVLDVADGAAAVGDIHAAGAKGASFLVDITDAGQVSRSVAEVEAALGPVDILVNNAGIYPNQPMDGMSFDQWRRVFAINVDSMFLTTQAFTPRMKERGWGRVVNMTSNAIALVIPGFTHYVASKMAVVGFTRGLATELADFGITVNAIGPSLVRTATTEAGPAAFFDVVPQMQAIKRVQVPADLAGTLAFLASDDAAFITGQTVYVDGGLVRAS